MEPAVLFPDATLVVVDYLRPLLAPASVHAKVPNPRPAGPFLVVRRTGGPRGSLVHDLAQMTLDAWGPTEAAAHDLAQLARAHLHAMRGSVQGGVAVYRVTEFAGPGNLPDPLSDSPRFTQTFQLGLRGQALP